MTVKLILVMTVMALTSVATLAADNIKKDVSRLRSDLAEITKSPETEGNSMGSFRALSIATKTCFQLGVLTQDMKSIVDAARASVDRNSKVASNSLNLLIQTGQEFEDLIKSYCADSYAGGAPMIPGKSADFIDYTKRIDGLLGIATTYIDDRM